MIFWLTTASTRLAAAPVSKPGRCQLLGIQPLRAAGYAGRPVAALTTLEL